MKTIYFYSQILDHPISLSIFDSESLYNAQVTYNSIGKLVRFENEKVEPYIARSWDTNGKTWTFNLHSDLRCEDGELITPEAFKKSLLRTLAWQSKVGSVPVFEDLVGYEEFKKSGKGLEGIVADNKANTLTFRFTKTIRSGLLEYLAMSPFGYLCDGNFVENQWKDKQQLISSGGYIITYNVANHYHVLTKRSDWPLNPPGASERVVLTGKSSHVKEWGRAIVMGEQIPRQAGAKMQLLKGTPLTLLSLSLLPSGTGFFSDIKNRQAFYKRFRELQEEDKFDTASVNSTTSFYSTQPFAADSIIQSWQVKASPRPPKEAQLIRGLSSNDSDWQRYAHKLVQKTFDSLEWPAKIMIFKPDSRDEIYSQKFDARLVGAEVGAGVQAWVNKFLFYSTIGPQFPDPAGEVCAINHAFENENIDYEEFKRRFNETLVRQASVLPVLNLRYVWHLGDKIQSLSPMTNIPAYDKVLIE